MVDEQERARQLQTALAVQRRRRVQGSLLEWCTEVLAPYGQAPARHHRLIIAALEKVAAGEIDRLMIAAPPGSAKSTYVTKLFPAHWLCRYPRTAVISASHTGDLAEDFGRHVRNIVNEHHDLLGYKLSADSQAAAKWHTDKGGEYHAIGVGKAISGRRADLVVIDDAVASREDADSLLKRERVYNWYRGDIYDRIKPGARIIVIMTRFHEDDLVGRLIQDEEQGADQWTKIFLPAIAETDDDPLGRLPGEALWPEWEDERKLARKRMAIGEREWASKYMQRPAPQGGAIFNPDQIHVLDAIPEFMGSRPDENVVQFSAFSRNLRIVGRQKGPAPEPVKRVRGWDLAATSALGTRDPDYTVGGLMMRTPYKRYIIEDVIRARLSPQGTMDLIETAHRADDPDITYAWIQDPGQAGKAQVAALARLCAGRRLLWRVPSGEKATGAQPFAAQINVGNVSMLRAGWNGALKDELAAFPSGSHDDQVDALTEAFARLLPPKEAVKDTRGRYMAHPAIYRR